mgnify:CR=1 FL=1
MALPVHWVGHLFKDQKNATVNNILDTNITFMFCIHRTY